MPREKRTSHLHAVRGGNLMDALNVSSESCLMTIRAKSTTSCSSRSKGAMVLWWILKGELTNARPQPQGKFYHSINFTLCSRTLYPIFGCLTVRDETDIET